jgi:exopolyphosphatase/guanosine-5'-triphosphate,3'-diphosphate pyrophosphatase
MPVAAVIDVGTNSTRLLVAEKDRGALKELIRITRITRLGEGLLRNGYISIEALDRTADVILDYLQTARNLKAENISIFATQAVREASNSLDVANFIEEKTGTKLRILTGEEEALLSFKGASSDFPERPLAVVDIGGGSTELVVGSDEPYFSVSIPVGCVKVEEEFNLKTAVSWEEASRITEEIKKRLAEKIPFSSIEKFETAVFVGGTATTIAAIKLGLVEYSRQLVHGAEVLKDELRKIAYELSTRDANSRLERFPVIEKDRAYVISAGALIMVAVLEILGADRFRVSEKDILDGYLIYFTP